MQFSKCSFSFWGGTPFFCMLPPIFIVLLLSHRPTIPNLVYLSFSEQFPYRWAWNDSHAHMHTSKEEERYLKALGGGWVSLCLTNPHLTSFPSSQCPFNVCSFFLFFLWNLLFHLLIHAAALLLSHTGIHSGKILSWLSRFLFCVCDSFCVWRRKVWGRFSSCQQLIKVFVFLFLKLFQQREIHFGTRHQRNRGGHQTQNHRGSGKPASATVYLLWII